MKVDWSMARQVARLTAGAGSAPSLGAVDFAAHVAAAEPQLRAYTGIAPRDPLPPPEAVDRPEWVDVNVGTLARLLGPVVERLGSRLDVAGPLAAPLQVVAGTAVAAEIGLVVGYMSQRVLGQYELSLLEPELPGRLLFVAPNLARALADQDVDRDSFLAWIVLHELTHVFQFAGVDWLRPHLAGLLREYLDTVEVRMDRRRAGGLPSLPNPGKLVEAFREGGLVALVQTAEQRQIMDRLQAVMCVIEGYSEHVMDAVGEQVLPAYAGLRDAMEARRRSRSAPERLLQRLLGFDLKMRQYELGKRFCDTVARDRGIEFLNRVWSSADALPTMAELDNPSAWAARLDAAERPAVSAT